MNVGRQAMPGLFKNKKQKKKQKKKLEEDDGVRLHAEAHSSFICVVQKPTGCESIGADGEEEAG